MLLGSLLWAGGGCARTPAGAGINVRNRLIVRVEVQGRVDPSHYYFVAFNATTEQNTTQGPLPVVASPWGNGWGAGRITHYVLVELGQYRAFRFPVTDNPARDLISPVPANDLLVSYENITPESRTFSFALDLDKLQTPAGTPATALNVNIIATNLLPLSTQNSAPDKLVDALGQRAGNNFITIPIIQSQIIQNNRTVNPERPDDVDEPNLDIVDWQVEVQRHS